MLTKFTTKFEPIKEPKIWYLTLVMVDASSKVQSLLMILKAFRTRSSFLVSASCLNQPAINMHLLKMWVSLSGPKSSANWE